jgi:hypothetical protein
VQVAGQDVAGGDRIDLDLSHNVLIQVQDPTLVAAADAVELSFSYVGVEVDSASAPLLEDGTADIDPGIAQRFVGGAATGTVTLLADDDVVIEHELGVEATQAWYLTLPFIGAALVLLLALANLESSLKPLRSGRSRKLSYVGTFISGALLGVSFVLVSGALGASEPTIPSFGGAAALGAIAGVSSARARIGVARRRRVRKAVKRAEKVLGVRATIV